MRTTAEPIADNMHKPDTKYSIWSVFITASLVLFAATLLFGILLHGRISGMMLEQIRGNALDIAGIAADLVDSETFDRITPGADDLERFYAEGDIENYTIRVHALKSSSRMIGAVALSAQAQALEAMGNARAAQGADDAEVRRMDEANREMLASYRALAQTLRDVFGFAEEGDADDADKPEMDPEELRELYDGVLEFAEIYDLDAIESLLQQAAAYRIPESEKERFAMLVRSVRASDWSGLKDAICGGGVQTVNGKGNRNRRRVIGTGQQEDRNTPADSYFNSGTSVPLPRTCYRQY
ncbi:MAG: Hpt domain-containing protein [Lachnospiraceae bacterium]|nr:Hpt domain-containing protein [Lachnospiraceae bacterium]